MTETNITMAAKSHQRPVITQKFDELIASTWLVIAILAVEVLLISLGGIAYVPTCSMEPTLQVGSILLYRYAPAEELTYDDIVLFFPEADLKEPVKNGLEAVTLFRFGKEATYVKRVIGLPGDVLEMKDGYVYRNGEKLDLDYIAEPMVTKDKTYEIPEGCVFCMGDNRNQSYDSRYMGPVPSNNFFGKVIAVFQ